MSRSNRAAGGDVKGALGLAAFLTVVGMVLDNAVAGLCLTPLVYLLLVYAASKSPLRYSLAVLSFFVLTLDNPDEAFGSSVYRSPFFRVGSVLLTHWNAIDRSIGLLSPMAFSGLDLCLLALSAIALSRRSNGSSIDAKRRLVTPRPLLTLAKYSVAGVAFMWVWGLVRGGNFSMSLWQVQRVIYLPLVFYLFQTALRGPRDHALLAKVLISAAVYRAVMATYIMWTVTYEGQRLPHATTHHDSILFATAVVLLASFFVEKVGKKAKRIALMVLPVLVAGMVSNHRRMVWVQVALVLLAIFFVTPDSKIKRRIHRAVAVAVPVVLVYVMAGWNSGSGVFRPVQTLRSVVDAKSDGSTMWREIENFDIIMTARMNPVLGSGYGHPWQEIIALPQIPYDLERYVPHNSILGLWCYGGYVGFTLITLFWVAGVYLAIRAHGMATDPAHRAAAIVAFGTVLIYMVQCWGDMGLGAFTGVFTVAPALAVAGKLATATGAWGAKKQPRPKPASPARSEPPPWAEPDARKVA